MPRAVIEEERRRIERGHCSRTIQFVKASVLAEDKYFLNGVVGPQGESAIRQVGDTLPYLGPRSRRRIAEVDVAAAEISPLHMDKSTEFGEEIGAAAARKEIFP